VDHGRHWAPLWWLWAWVAWVGFNLVLLVLYPTVIAPLFNKFEPLPDEALKARVQALMQRCGFAAKGLFVMDGSKRSAHANAYFTGLGAAKRVVFFDTLLSRLSPGEVEAVLAHELGHFKHRHVLKRMVAIFAPAWPAWRCWAGWRRRAASTPGWAWPQPGGAPTTRWRCCCSAGAAAVHVLHHAAGMAHLSRRHEFEADAYACAQADGSDLANALLKLHEDNAATLTPDPVYVRFYYSHPPASERLAALARGRSPHDGADHAPARTTGPPLEGQRLAAGEVPRTWPRCRAGRWWTARCRRPSFNDYAPHPVLRQRGGWLAQHRGPPPRPAGQLGPLHGALAHALGGRLSINDFICAAKVDALLP
jgi:Zn-dependent protease with chaperone function